MQESLPLSVIMSVFNAEAFIKDSVESILGQSMRDFEVIIIDDASNDNTWQLLQSYRDERIKLFRNEVNTGLTVNLNKAIGLASGKYLVRMDADDISLPGRFDAQYRFMEKHPEVAICGTWYQVFGKDEVIAKYQPGHREIALQFLYECHVCHPTIIMRKKVLVKNNLFYNPEFITAQDYDLMSRVARVAKLANIPEVLLKYRWHAESISTRKRELQQANKHRVIANQFAEMGSKLSAQEIDLFVSFCNGRFSLDEETISKLEDVLLRIINANRRTHYLPESDLQSFLAEKWFHTCYNSSNLGLNIYRKYLASEMYAYRTLGFGERIKFFFKSLLRKK